MQERLIGCAALEMYHIFEKGGHTPPTFRTAPEIVVALWLVPARVYCQIVALFVGYLWRDGLST
jgi:hypothetical protein